jgi:hypothetical protein
MLRCGDVKKKWSYISTPWHTFVICIVTALTESVFKSLLQDLGVAGMIILKTKSRRCGLGLSFKSLLEDLGVAGMIILKTKSRRCGLGLSASGYGFVERSCEYGNEMRGL